MCLYKVSMLIVSHCVVKTTRVKLVECFLSAELLQLRIPQRPPNVAGIWRIGTHSKTTKISSNDTWISGYLSGLWIRRCRRAVSASSTLPSHSQVLAWWAEWRLEEQHDHISEQNATHFGVIAHGGLVQIMESVSSFMQDTYELVNRALRISMDYNPCLDHRTRVSRRPCSI